MNGRDGPAHGAGRVDSAPPPVRCADAIDDRAFAAIRRRTIFGCFKWDPQVGDVASLSRVPLVLTADAWSDLARLAEDLASEILAAERELTARPDLWRELAVPWSIRRALRAIGRDGPPAEIARLVRFDFHATDAGWRISEANTDVPGGFVEAQGFTELVADHLGDRRATAGAPATEYARAVARQVPSGSSVALVHATAYSDDRQVMQFVGRELERAGLRPVLASPEHLRWDGGRARVDTVTLRTPVSAVLRFFPAEWLPNCGRSCGWRRFFAGSATPIGNPATALLTQSKRLPLVWDRLRTPMRTWRRLLPETIPVGALRDSPGPGWVLKPAFGRVGDGIGIEGVTPPKDMAAIVRAARRNPRDWVLQRRFAVGALASADGPLHPCLGVYVVDGRACGVYGRVARRALVAHDAQDAAVVVERTVPAPVAARCAHEVTA